MLALSKKASTAIKVLIVSVASILLLYTIYGVVGCFYLLSLQPSFMTPEGLSVSKGFWLQGLIYVGIMCVVFVLLSLLVYFFFFHSRVKERIRAKRETKLKAESQEE